MKEHLKAIQASAKDFILLAAEEKNRAVFWVGTIDNDGKESWFRTYAEIDENGDCGEWTINNHFDELNKLGRPVFGKKETKNMIIIEIKGSAFEFFLDVVYGNRDREETK